MAQGGDDGHELLLRLLVVAYVNGEPVCVILGNVHGFWILLQFLDRQFCHVLAESAEGVAALRGVFFPRAGLATAWPTLT